MIRRLTTLAIVGCVVGFGSGFSATAETGVDEPGAPGLAYQVLLKGRASDAERYRIVLGTFDRQSDASSMLERLAAQGFAAIPESEGHEYWIATPSMATRAEAEAIREALLDAGYPGPLEIDVVVNDPSSPDGPWRVHVLEADPRRIDVQVAHSMDAAIGLETTLELAERRGAAAAVNGGYYRMQGRLAGDSQGVLVIDGRLVSEPDRGRGAVGFFSDGGVTRAVFGRLAWSAAVTSGATGRLPIDGINRPRSASDIVVYTPEFHRTTLTGTGGVEVVVREGRVTALVEGQGSAPIPPDGFVISFGIDRVPEVAGRFAVGTPAELDLDVEPLLPDPDGLWARADDIVGGGPLMLRQGRRLEEPAEESMSQVFFRARHPRTAVGLRADGTLVFVVVDGRRPGVSVGMSIPELTDLMVELGCVSAVNLDGGGSTTMVIDDRIVNQPTDSNGARANGDGILLFPRSRFGGSS